ncbi:uncharacterized protein LOC106402578 [Brassica napus]|uniref:uncharacterized protein LOC106402578 n=1 Tax=Brassica napus TaxID=3708 RepID=UPI0006AAF846|nr:uncharacterized protein LOC106402578 [Brassica napus]
MADRGSKGSFNNHKSYRGDGDGSRYRSSRRDEPQVDVQEGHARNLSRQTGAQQLQGEVRDEAQEDGEIRAPESLNKTRPSPAFQAEHDKTQKIGTDALSDPMEVEKGLQIIQSLVEKAPVLEDDKVMNMDEFRAVFLEHGIDMDATDDLPDVSDGEIEEMLKEQEEGDNIQGEVEVGNDAEEKVQVEGEVGKKNGSRKRLFKPTLGTAVSTKMRIANALASPRKRAPNKT